jgi:phenylacetate-CoA ligase
MPTVPQPSPPRPSQHGDRRAHWRTCSRAELEKHQVARLNQLLAHVLGAENDFYRRKYHADALRLTELADLKRLPVLEKSEIDAGDGSPARFHTAAPANYLRFHRTSGTKGQPMPVMDTTRDWQWWIDTWQYVLDAGRVSHRDVAMMAFSFGPFVGFWSAADALLARGTMVVPGGGLSTEARLQLIAATGATIVCCTPTYALHMAETAARAGVALSELPVRLLIVAGEPGGSIPEVRSRIESAWGARVLDHSGATELGPWGFGSSDGGGLHVIESEFVAELLVPGSDRDAAPGELAELVITGLGRFGAPAIRYRTGDLVRGFPEHDPKCRFLWLQGGILGRADDMVVIRGVNIFPSSIEQIIREFPQLGEFRLIASKRGAMDELEVEVEATAETQLDALRHRVGERLGLRIPIRAVPPESLPRFEAKAKRLEDRRV